MGRWTGAEAVQECSNMSVTVRRCVGDGLSIPSRRQRQSERKGDDIILLYVACGNYAKSTNLAVLQHYVQAQN